MYGTYSPRPAWVRPELKLLRALIQIGLQEAKEYRKRIVIPGLSGFA